MSEPVKTWRPLIEVDADGRRIGGSEAAHADERRALAEIIRFAGDRSESAPEFDAAAEDGSLDWAAADSPAREPVIRGDFADIEAALLGAARPGAVASGQAELREAPPWARLGLRASRPDADALASRFATLSAPGLEAPDAAEHPAPLLSAVRDAALYPEADAPSDNFMLFDDAAVSGSAALADEDKRSRRPIYIMAALVLAGIAGMAATSFRWDGAGEIAQEASKPAAMAPLAAETAPASSTQSAAASAADPAQQAAAEPAAAAAAPAADAAPRVISFSEPPASTQATSNQAAPTQAASTQAAAALPPVPPAPSEMATGSILAPPPPGGAQLLAEPSVKAAMGEAKKVKTAAVRPDGSLVKAEPPATKAPPQGALNKELPAKTPLAKDAAAVKDAAVKAAKVAHLKTPHPAAVAAATSATAAAHAKPAPVATAAKAKPAANEDAQAAPPSPQPATAAQNPAPASTGPLAFVDTAVNSITGATGKLLDWGRTASSGAHN
jgi:hypothetical protein